MRGTGRTAQTNAQRGGADRRLVDAFCEFYAEVVTLKRSVAQGATPTPFDVVQQRLLDLFEAQAARISPSLPEHEVRVFEEARYVMIAMADEVFLRLDWAGRLPWSDKPLEAIVFRSRDAGDRFFRRIDDVLAGRSGASSQLLTVYLTALALGFRGRYGPAAGTTEPETYRKRLVEYLSRVDPDVVRGDDEICVEAHQNTLDSAPKKGLPKFARGVIPFVAVLIGWIVISEIIWLYRTSELDDVLDRIEGAS